MKRSRQMRRFRVSGSFDRGLCNARDPIRTIWNPKPETLNRLLIQNCILRSFVMRSSKRSTIPFVEEIYVADNDAVSRVGSDKQP